MTYAAARRGAVALSHPLLLQKREKNREYLLSLNTDALLVHHRAEACLGVGIEPEHMHGGWEDATCQLRGHFLGHWLSAAAMHYAATGDAVMKARADEIVDALALCQAENGNGWAGSIPEKYLERIAKGKRIWAPHYTVHKTFMGLVDMHVLADSEKALAVADGWAAWFLAWTDSFTREEMDDILDVETGGMLEIWADLYAITKKDMYLTLLKRYRRSRLFDPLLAGKDVLTNMHANTTIPEVLGAARAYEATGDATWLEIVRAYWDCAVTKRGTFCTGGQTSGEIWTPPFAQAARLGDKNQEHCTVYNMMRLSEFLFRVTGEASYADYWEQNLYNGILAQAYWTGNFTHGQKSAYPSEGLLTYFLPLRTGGQKGWSSRTEDFFCCHGTLVQANASLDRGIYFLDDAGITVCQYLDSVLSIKVGGTDVQILQREDRLVGSEHLSSSSTGSQRVNPFAAEYPHNPNRHVAVLSVRCQEEAEFSLKLRIPWWIAGEATLTVNEEAVAVAPDGKGFVEIKRVWKDDTVRISLPKTLRAWPLPDRKDTAAFLYGPVVLAGLCDEAAVLRGPMDDPSVILAPDNEREWGRWMGTFRAVGQTRDIRFIPLHKVGYEPYTVYFRISRDGEENEQS